MRGDAAKRRNAAKIEALLPQLRAVLEETWNKVQAQRSEQFTLLHELFEARLPSWVDGGYNGRITNTEHMELARQMGFGFTRICAENGIAIGTCFPGDFKTQSSELENVPAAGLNTQRFVMPVFMDGMEMGSFQVDFIHEPKKFGFVQAPQLSFMPLQILPPIRRAEGRVGGGRTAAIE